MAERNVDVAHPTILRWVHRYVPEFEKRWQRYARPVGTSWRVDETYLKVKGKWVYLYRAVDRAGQTVDFLLSEHRDIAAAKRFFTQAIEKRGVPEKMTLDGYAASHVAVAELQEEDVLPTTLTVRTNKYLNNVIEQDHRRVKQRVRSMLGFKRFANAMITISGIELVHQIKKNQFDISALCVPSAQTPQVWEAVLAA
jgi:putative transposase